MTSSPPYKGEDSLVNDSTCLIGLERIERLDVLPALLEPVLIPPAVQQEFGIALPWLRVEAPAASPPPSTTKARWSAIIYRPY